MSISLLINQQFSSLNVAGANVVPRVPCDSLQTRDSGSGDHTPPTVQTAVMVSAGLKPESH